MTLQVTLPDELVIRVKNYIKHSRQDKVYKKEIVSQLNISEPVIDEIVDYLASQGELFTPTDETVEIV